ncbi:aspartic peptidase domain-containing protein [Leucosporidium creatinivorum]|uniref:Aspartic peptidase domain-containing protein n=1 Tax=Leucosporidium creatinivorum TaxID=106004 RepID=A0A1Y2ERS1_9BASI|nr:aspartic peptidase domain-containing protein [Leucosporidium creatinivorum]
MVTFALTALALLASSVSALHSIPLTRRSGYVLESGAVNLTAFQNEVSLMATKYEKNNRILRTNLFNDKATSRSKLRERGAVSLAIKSYAVWTGPSYIGTPAQSFVTYFDTGSSDFTVADSSCPTSSCGSKARYTVSKSSTAVTTTTTVTTNFADGTSSKGTLIKDTVKIGGLTVTGQAVISSSSLSSTVADLDSDALMGLAWPALSSAYQNPVPFTQYDQGVGTKGVFGLALSMTAGKSSLTFGGYDRTKMTGIITYYPCGLTTSAAYRTYWQIAASAPFVNGVQAITTRVNMILDSGTTLIIAPAAAAAQFWAAVPGSAKLDSNFWTFPCDSPPDVTFGLTRVMKKWAVNPDDFNLGVIEGDESRCLGAVATQNLGLGTSWILGDTFLMNWYTIYDVQNSRIGLATKK